MVLIKQYNGYDINYDSDKLFWVEVQGVKALQLATEKDATIKIDELLKLAEEKKKKEEEDRLCKEIPDFTITLAEPSYLKDGISLIKNFSGDCRFIVDKQSIKVVLMDAANVALIDWNLLSSVGVEWKVPHKFYLDFRSKDLFEVLQKATPYDMIKLEKGDKEHLVIWFNGRIKRKYTIPLYELDYNETKIPELSFEAEIDIPVKLFEQQVKECSIVGESLRFSTANNNFEISSEGDLKKYSSLLKEDDDIHIKTNGEQIVKYSIEYLKFIALGKKVADTIKLRFKKDYPLRAEFKLMDKVVLNFILAPRVEND